MKAIALFVLLGSLALASGSTSKCPPKVANLSGGRINKERSLPASDEFTAAFLDQDHYILTPTHKRSGPNSSYGYAAYAIKKYPQFYKSFEVSIDDQGRIVTPTIERLNALIKEMNRSGSLSPKVAFYEDTSARETSDEIYFEGLTEHDEIFVPISLRGNTEGDGSLFLHDMIVHGIGYLTLTAEQARDIQLTFRYLKALKTSSLLARSSAVRAWVKKAISSQVFELDQITGIISDSFVNDPRRLAEGLARVFAFNPSTLSQYVLNQNFSSPRVRKEVRRISRQWVKNRANGVFQSRSYDLEHERQRLAKVLSNSSP